MTGVLSGNNSFREPLLWDESMAFAPGLPNLLPAQFPDWQRDLNKSFENSKTDRCWAVIVSSNENNCEEPWPRGLRLFRKEAVLLKVSSNSCPFDMRQHVQ
jgi:hypothetical protein